MYSSRNRYYNNILQPRAKTLRHTMTKAEVCLWKYVLRAGKMMGFQFRRQRPVLKYIADFMCKELMLIVECDGITHNDEEAMRRDQRRQKELEEHGFTVIRFADAEVVHDLSGVKAVIEMEIRRILAEISTPLIPRQRGTGIY